MQTFSHTILTAALKEPLDKWIEKQNGRVPPAQISAMLIGSFLPDVLLILISIWAIVTDMVTGAFREVDFAAAANGESPPADILEISKTAKLFETWFFENPWVIAAQNLFHAPILLLCYIALAYWLWRNGRQYGGWLFWLFCAAFLHTLIDIPLHVNDGPLLLFPFEWHYRFRSRISYWDRNYYGDQWSRFESGLNGVLLLFLLWHHRQSIRHWVLQQLGRWN